jgi:hypothetical protein
MMPRKRKIDARRHPNGKVNRGEPGIDRGTPELQVHRIRWLGERGHPMERLSHGNPVDILCAQGYLTHDHVDAARAYQHHHAIVYGPLSARAAEIDRKHGRGISTRRELLIRAELRAWDRRLGRLSGWHIEVFRSYVLLGEIDGAIVDAARFGGAIAGLIDGASRKRISALIKALELVRTAPPVRITSHAVDAAVRAEGRATA